MKYELENEMYIKRLKINNFRGIRELNWKLNNKFICLIGPGDSTKTTILDAIEWVLYPYWNINVSDYDFYNCDVENNIKIEISIGDLPEEFIREESFGLYLRKDVEREQDDDEPDENEESFITIRLEINKYYEQEWIVINNRLEGKKISTKDRMKLSVGRIGEYFYKDFNLGRNSVLKKYGDDFENLDKRILNVYRKIKDDLDISNDEDLKKIIKNITDATKEYAIAPNNEFNAKIDIKNSELGYDILVLIDSDEPNALKMAEEIKQEGIKVISWDDNVSTEERIFLDMPREKIQSLIDICIELYTEETIKQWIKLEITKDTSQYAEIEKYLGEKEARKLLGKVSKERKWFKRIDKGEILGDIITEYYDLFDSNKDIIKKLEQVKEWSYES